MPLVSIITANYNNSIFLKEAIESVLNQSWQDWEWIIVDDGSSDPSVQILDEITDERVKVIAIEQNQGVSKARNVGLEKMTGDFFCFLDSDDCLPPRSLEARLDVFKNSGNIMFVDGAVSVRDTTLIRELTTFNPAFNGKPLNCLLELDEKCFFGPTWMIRRKPGYVYRFHESITHGEDLLFYISISEHGLYDYTQETVLNYRKHATNAMSNLKGLENGYREITKRLTDMDHIPRAQVKKFAERTRFIMLKSYLKKRQFLAALNTLTKPWP